MYISSRKANILSNLFVTLSKPLQENEIRIDLGRDMLDLLDADYFVSYAWNAGTKKFEGLQSINMDDRLATDYEHHFQFVDPITPLLQVKRTPTLVTQVMKQECLMKTEFYSDFLAKGGLHWGLNMYAWDQSENIGDLRFWRNKNRSNFDTNELHIMRMLQSAFATSLQRARQIDSPTVEAPNLLPCKKNSSLIESLSEREYQIIEQAAKGLSDKEIARQLSICFTTVRTHINSAFRKLGINNRVKLTQIFIQNLMG